MSLTCVSCYYPVKNKHEGQYHKWFINSLAINCPYVFFTTKDHIEYIRSFRKDLPTYFIECAIEEFTIYPYRDKMITHPYHCPSVELNLIWNEKIFFIKKAYDLNPFQTEWFKWVDAGICVYRDVAPSPLPFPNPEKMENLPKDQFIFSSSEAYRKDLILPNNYYHHISGTYLMHKDIINTVVEIYHQYLTLIDTNNIWTDQVLWTHIYNDFPQLFFKLCEGYGAITQYLMP
jgi:hypothetical protein